MTEKIRCCYCGGNLKKVKEFDTQIRYLCHICKRFCRSMRGGDYGN